MLCPSDRESVESNESNTALKGEKSKLAIILDKAKSKGKKLVSSNKAKKSSGKSGFFFIEILSSLMN